MNKYDKDDIIKVKSLLQNNDINNIYIGLSLAFNTLNMSKREVDNLFNIDDVKDMERIDAIVTPYSLFIYKKMFYSFESKKGVIQKSRVLSSQIITYFLTDCWDYYINKHFG